MYISQIERLQKKCVRIMTFAPFNSHTNPIFQELELLKVQDVIKIHQLKLVFDFHRGSLPDDLMNLFKLTTDVQATYLGLSGTENNLLYTPRSKTMTFGERLIGDQCPKVWNHTFKNGTLQIELVKKTLNLIRSKLSTSLKNR